MATAILKEAQEPSGRVRFLLLPECPGFWAQVPLRGLAHRGSPTASMPPGATVTARPEGGGLEPRGQGPGRATALHLCLCDPMAASALLPASTNTSQTKSLFCQF